MAYLNDLVSIVLVHIDAIYPPIEHLEISPVLVDSLSLSILPLLRQISLTNPVEEGHHPPLMAILFEDGYTPMPQMTILTISVFC